MEEVKKSSLCPDEYYGAFRIKNGVNSYLQKWRLLFPEPCRKSQKVAQNSSRTHRSLSFSVNPSGDFDTSRSDTSQVKLPGRGIAATQRQFFDTTISLACPLKDRMPEGWMRIPRSLPSRVLLLVLACFLTATLGLLFVPLHPIEASASAIHAST